MPPPGAIRACPFCSVSTMGLHAQRKQTSQQTKMRRLLDDEPRTYTGIVFCTSPRSFLHVVEDSLIHVLELDEQGGLETEVSCGKCDWRR